MDIGTENADQIVNVGGAANLYSLYSTVAAILGVKCESVALGMSFIESGCCNAGDCKNAYEQLVVINDELSKHAPSEAVWDIEHPSIRAPWEGHLASTITSCADLHTTAEGEILMQELISLLRFAESTNQGVVVLG